MQQRYIVELLDRLGCLRRDQIYILTRDRFETEEFTISEARMDTMLHQLAVHFANIHVDENYVRYSAIKPNAMLLEAVDVMLELSNGYPIDFSASRAGKTLLRFALGGDPPKRFAVAAYSIDALPLQTNENVVWISETTALPERLVLSPGQFYAQRQEDGSHRFFGANT